MDLKTALKLYIDEMNSYKHQIDEASVDTLNDLLDISMIEKADIDEHSPLIGDIYLFLCEHAAIEYLIVDITGNGLYLVMQVSEWVEFASEQDFLFDDAGIKKMVQTGNIYLVSQEKVANSYKVGGMAESDLQTIIDTVKKQKNLPARRRGKTANDEDRFFQERFRTIEVDNAVEHLHTDNKNLPIPVPLSLSAASFAKIASPAVGAAAIVGMLAVSNFMLPLGLMTKAIIAPAILLKTLSLFRVFKDRKVLQDLGFDSEKKPDWNKLKELLKSASGLLFPFFLSSSIYQKFSETSFRERFLIEQTETGDIAIIINKRYIGKQATLTINDQPVYEGTLKPLYSFHNQPKDIIPALKKELNIELKKAG